MKKLFYLFLLLLCYLSNTDSFSQEIIISKNSKIDYYDEGDLPNNWYELTLQNTKWKTGTTPIGYGDKKVKTNIYFGNDPEHKDIIKYFKRTFYIRSLEKWVAFEMKFQRDDGIAVYINNKEVIRDNLPVEGMITNKTFASERIDRKEEKVFYSKVLQQHYFKEGKNTIKISIHQFDTSSSDCILNFELIGYTSFKELNASIDNNIIIDIKKQFDLDKALLELNILKSTNENLKFILFLITLLLILSLIGSSFLIIHYNKKIRINNSTFINCEKEKIQLEKEMITLSTRLLYNRQNLKEIRADIKGITTNDTSSINNINKQIDTFLKTESDWNVLQKHFDAVFGGFYESLIKKHPTLTETELRHCMFIRLHLHTKEIARILLIDPRSVQTSRYRIKKKLNLNEEDDLRNYLLNL